MKSLKRMSMAVVAGALAITVIIGMTACDKEKTRAVTHEHLSFKTASIGYATEETLPQHKVRHEKGKVIVKVPENTTCVIVNLGGHFKHNNGLLGKDTTFTRSEMTGVGKIYELVGNDTSKENRVWREYGVTETGEGINKTGGLKYSNVNFPTSAKTGLAIFHFHEDRSEINFFTARDPQTNEPIYSGANYHFGHPNAMKDFTLTITGHNGKKHKLHLIVEVDTATEA